MYSYKVCCIFISAWALVLLFQRSWAMREPLIAGMSNVYSSRAFFYAVPMNLQSACPGNCRHNMFGRHEYRDAVFMGS